MLLTNTPLIHEGLHGQPCAHLSVTEIEVCQDYQDADWSFQAAAAAERAAERHIENAGYWEARMQEGMENQHGVIQFGDAYAQALGYIDAGERERAEAHGADLADMLDQL